MGRTSDKLRKLLENEGFSITELTPPVGHWRTSPYADVYRWEGRGTLNGIAVSFSSWDPMTACVRGGIALARYNGKARVDYGTHYDVSAKEVA